jgi:hypothetical protein
MKYTFLLLTLIPLTLSAQSFTFDKKSGKAVPTFVAELKLLKGRVMKTTGGRPRVVQIGEKFYPKDVVETDADSSLKMIVADDTWLALGPNSELVFTDFEFKEKTDRTINYELKKGQLSANVRQKVKSGEVNFRTRFASMGVRGTKVLMNFREVKGKAITEYALVEGKAEVTDQKGTVHPLSAGERIVIMEDQKTKEAGLEKLQLSKEELESFTSPDADEDKGIKPFMPYYEPKAMQVTTATPEAVKSKPATEATTAGDGSFQNLKKLNEQLKENKKR